MDDCLKFNFTGMLPVKTLRIFQLQLQLTKTYTAQFSSEHDQMRFITARLKRLKMT